MLISVLIIYYVLLTFLILWGWFRLKSDENFLEPTHSISILVPFRNESDNIQTLLKSLKKLDYPSESYEIILIDDHSEDNTVHLAKTLNLKNFRIVKARGEGKKKAIQTGVAEAKYDYIAQTDADCVVPETWLKCINKAINQHQALLISAPVLIQEERSVFSRLQSLESYALSISTTGLFGAKHPIMMNGANLAYRKDILKDAQALRTDIASGDDVFLLHHIKKKYGSKAISCLNTPQSTVFTRSEKKFSSFFNQRIRWASKSKHYKDADSFWVGLGIMLTNLSIPVLLILSCFYPYFFKPTLMLWLSKSIVDLLLLVFIVKKYQKGYLLSYFLPLAVIYPFYVSFVGIISQFINFKWKNRVYNGK